MKMKKPQVEFNMKMGVLHSFSIENIFCDEVDFRFFFIFMWLYNKITAYSICIFYPFSLVYLFTAAETPWYLH